jgi:5'-nucleotidase/UDP-sugar diphosphatase
MFEYSKYFTTKWITLLLLIITVYGSNAQSSSGQTDEIIILHINDMHAKLNNMAKLAHLIKVERAKNKNVILVGAGDIFTGNPLIDMVAEKGQPYIKVLNMLDFDVMTVGNHEFDYGQTVLNKRISEAEFPFVMANYSNSSAPLSKIAPLYIHDFKEINFSMAIVGLIENSANGLPSSMPTNFKGLSFTNALVAMNDYTYLKDENNALIALTHTGLELDTLLAKKYPELDIVVGGHSHTVINPPITIANTLVVQTGSYISHLGKITLQVENGKIISKKGELISLSDYALEDEAMQALVDEIESNDEFDAVVATLENPINGKSELGCFMADAIKYKSGTDIAFQNNGGIRITRLEKGVLSKKDILALEPFSNDIVIFELSRREIESLILVNTKAHADIDLRPAGLEYDILLNKNGNFRKIKMRLPNGKKLGCKKYKVAVSNYVASAYNFKRQDKEGVRTYDLISAALIDFVGNTTLPNYNGCERVKVVKAK